MRTALRRAHGVAAVGGRAGGWSWRSALMALAMALPAATGWYVHVHHFPPLHADWDPRVGPGHRPPALLVGVLGARCAVDARGAAAVAPAAGPRCSSAGLAWMLALAFVDGVARRRRRSSTTPYEYLRTARATTDLHATLQEYVGRIPYDVAAARNWPVHVAGHPPGALTFFVVLVAARARRRVRRRARGHAARGDAPRSPCWSPLRLLGAERMARRAAPFLVFGPAAIWQAVSARRDVRRRGRVGHRAPALAAAAAPA